MNGADTQDKLLVVREGEGTWESENERELEFALTLREHLGAMKENDESYPLAKYA